MIGRGPLARAADAGLGVVGQLIGIALIFGAVAVAGVVVLARWVL